MEDASLDDFLDADGEDDPATGDADGDDPATSNANEDAGTINGDETVDPATPTYQWSPGGADCDSCGGDVKRRWHSEAGLVCADCKEW